MRLPYLLCIPVFGLAQTPRECTFQRNPDEVLTRQSRVYRQAFDNMSKFSARAASTRVRNVDAAEIPRTNFIDDYIFSKLEERGIQSAPISSDEEFMRRISLDFTGRIPSPDEIRAFAGSTDGDKRNQLIDKLAASDAFVDKWSMYFSDLLQNNAFPSNFDRQINGRNNYYLWIREKIKTDHSLKDFAKQLVTGTGNHFDFVAGGANFPIASKTPMGPVQDTYDTMLAMTASTFLGLGEMDCLLCHNGRGHLDQVNLWGSRVSRVEAWKMAAFFSRLDMPQRNLPTGDPYWRSFDVRDKTTGSYDLNTLGGNRPDRVPIGSTRTITPEYLGGQNPADSNWRVAFAELMVKDRMFSRNLANRLWKEMFTLALAEPVDSLDPARLDPRNPPPEPWTMQSTHPELLEQLADFLTAFDFNMRGVLRTIARTSAYQLSSRYDGEWKYEYVTSFARHYPRRLMAEEIHDAITKSTGQPGSYAVEGLGTLNWAMQLPEPAEPRGNGSVATFLNFFLRGNRDSQPRSSNLSVLQQMYLMNDSLVTNRTKVAASPTLAAISKLGSVDDMITELHLLFLGRMPTTQERSVAAGFLTAAKDATERNAFLEDLAWVLINKPEFLFNY